MPKNGTLAGRGTNSVASGNLLSRLGGEEEGKHQICLMPEWMVAEHGGDFARSPGKKLEIECFFSTDADDALHHCAKRTSAAQIKDGLNLLVLDKAQVTASFAHDIWTHKDGPGAKRVE